MKLPSSLTLLCGALLSPVFAQAADAPLTDTLKAFTRCDAGFFTSLQTHKAAWQPLAPLQQKNGATWIAVESRDIRGKQSVPLKGAPTIAGMKLLSYVDDITDLDSMGRYYYWGFIAEGGVDDVARQLAPLLAQPEQLHNMNGAYARSEIYTGGQWRLFQSPPGAAPGNKRAERVLIVEPEGKQGDRSRVTCSLQGAIDGTILAQLRPDIAPANYPKPVPLAGINQVALADALVARVDSPLLQPKFKSLTYSYYSPGSQIKDYYPQRVENRAENGLLKTTEIYGNSTQVERVTKAGLIQLKTQVHGLGDGRVQLVRDLEIDIPGNWAPGKTLSVYSVKAQVPEQPGESPVENRFSCTAGERFPARQIFASLTGDAITLDCKSGQREMPRAFIEDLGVAVPFKLHSTSEGYVYTAMDVVR